jgi:hypothetical protein
MSDTDRHELADQVAVLLQRAHPGELTKEELEEQSGLSNKELRQVLDSLSAEGELDPVAENFRWRDPSGEDKPPPERAEDEDHPAPLPTELPTGAPTDRIVLSVTTSVPHPPEGDDESTMNQALQLAEQVQNLLGTTGLGATVTVQRLEVYDKPRVLFDAAGQQGGGASADQ